MAAVVGRLLVRFGQHACHAPRAARKRWVFCFTLNPLRFERGTGSPANPIATF